MQSTSERIVLLPALPDAWKSGSVKGLCVKGGAEVDIYWQGGVLSHAIVRAKCDIRTKVRYKEEIRELELKAGEEKDVRF